MNFLKNILISTNTKNHQRFYLQEANKPVCSVNDTHVLQKRNYSPPDLPGSGAGKGGGAGGAIRESGGGLGQYGAAQEESFFHNKSREQLGKLKKQLKKEMEKPTEISNKPEKDAKDFKKWRSSGAFGDEIDAAMTLYSFRKPYSSYLPTL